MELAQINAGAIIEAYVAIRLLFMKQSGKGFHEGVVIGFPRVGAIAGGK